jgi:hypothetical protein
MPEFLLRKKIETVYSRIPFNDNFFGQKVANLNDYQVTYLLP